MARKLKGRGSKKSGRDKRKQQSSALEQRIKKGQQRKQLFPTIIANPDKYTLWRPGDGQHIIDILPYTSGKHDIVSGKGKETYTFEAWIHRNVGSGDSMIICPQETFKKPCPICEHRASLRERDAEKDVWKKLFPKRRNLYNIICYDVGQEKKGVQIWESPYFYSEENILAIAEEAERGGGTTTVNFPDAKDGKSISFKIIPAQSKNDYPTYKGFKFLDRDYSIKKRHLKECATLDEIVKTYNYDELAEMHFGDKTREEKILEDMGGGRKAKGKGKRGRHEREEKKDIDIEDMMDELEDCEDLDDLEEFAENYGFGITIKKKSKFKNIKRKLERMIMELKEDEDDEDEDEDTDEDEDYDEDTDDEDSDEDDDDEDDEDSDEDEDDEDEDDEDEDDESEYAYGDLIEMKRKELLKIIKKEDLDVDADDYDDIEDLAEAIAEELDIPF